MLFFGKENVFMCLVAFQKIFWKIFSGVWKRRRKRQTQKKKSSTIDAQLVSTERCFASSSPTIASLIAISPARSCKGEIAIDGAISRRRDLDLREIAIDASRDRDRQRDFATAWSRSSRSRDGTILIFAISRRRDLATSFAIFIDRDLGSRSSDWSSEFAGDRRTDWSSVFSSRARSLSLSLSLFGNTLKWKWKCKMISVVKARFFRSTDFNFQKLEFSGPTKQPHFQKSISGSDFHPKQTHPNWLIVPLTIVPC